jgi:hypothetical protein
VIAVILPAHVRVRVKVVLKIEVRELVPVSDNVTGLGLGRADGPVTRDGLTLTSLLVGEELRVELLVR